MTPGLITRSTGISPGVAWAGPLPGGGYQGKTKRLDRAACAVAAWLQRHFDCPVEIRFNSYRLSGGAYVYPDGKAGFGLPEIGLGAGLIIPEHVKQERERAWDRDEWRTLPPLEWLDCWTEETVLDYSVLVFAKYMAILRTLESTSRETNWLLDRTDSARGVPTFAATCFDTDTLALGDCHDSDVQVWTTWVAVSAARHMSTSPN